MRREALSALLVRNTELSLIFLPDQLFSLTLPEGRISISVTIPKLMIYIRSGHLIYIVLTLSGSKGVITIMMDGDEDKDRRLP
jgi:hypothetical protein